MLVYVVGKICAVDGYGLLSVCVANFRGTWPKVYTLGPIYTHHAVPMPWPCHYPAILRTCRKRAGRPHAVSGRPMLIHKHHAVPLPPTCRGLERLLSERHIRGMSGERHGMCESNTAALCNLNEKDTIKTLSGTAWHGNGMVYVNPPLGINQMHLLVLLWI
jgi:hypothetical protein